MALSIDNTPSNRFDNKLDFTQFPHPTTPSTQGSVKCLRQFLVVKSFIIKFPAFSKHFKLIYPHFQFQTNMTTASIIPNYPA